jgi:phosphoribosylglycinamide formyltransferase-1
VAALKVGVLISGRGSNLQALLDDCARSEALARIDLVISNNRDAPGLARATAAGVATATIDHRAFADRASFDDALDRALGEAGVELVCLAGFMRLLTPGFVARWRDRMINIHPSLLPAFPGLDTHAQVLAAGVRFSGCTVHFVRHATDTGPIIAQAVVPVRPKDTPDTLAARVLAAEHRLYPLALRLIADGRVRVAGETATVDRATVPEDLLFSPLEEEQACGATGRAPD